MSAERILIIEDDEDIQELFLSSRTRWVFTREQVVGGVRGEDCAVTERAAGVQVVGLRKKLGHCAQYIETVRGAGYRFKK